MSSLNPDHTLVQYDRGTALVVVDVQNDFADPNGSLSVAGGESIVPVVNAEIAGARSAGARVVYTADWHPPSTPHFATWGAEFHPNLIVDGPVVRKGTAGEDGYSGFTMKDPEGDTVTPTGLRDQLVRWGIDKIVVCGLATDYCVKATALDGISAGFDVVLLEEGIRPVDLEPGDGDRAIVAMAEAGCQLSSSLA